MFKALVRTSVPLAAFGVGIVAFPASLRKSNLRDKKLVHINEDVIHQIEALPEFQRLRNDPQTRFSYSSHTFPDQHHKSNVGSGLLYGKDLFEIDPILFLNETTGELTGYYHLGDKLVSQDGGIHNGIVSTILDEGLCYCGFPSLPSKRGVTAQLSIDFANQAPPNSTVVLRAKVTERKGRKVVIQGTLETLSHDVNVPPVKIAESRAVLVEPRWFKYLSWLEV